MTFASLSRSLILCHIAVLFCLCTSACYIMSVPFLGFLFWLSFYSCTVLAVLSWLSSPFCLILAVLCWQTCPGNPTLAVLSWKSHLAVLFCLSFSACPVPRISFAILAVLSVFSKQPYPGSFVLPVLCCLSNSACPFLPVPFCLSRSASPLSAFRPQKKAKGQARRPKNAPPPPALVGLQKLNVVQCVSLTMSNFLTSAGTVS
jgi:hypothetical protein